MRRARSWGGHQSQVQCECSVRGLSLEHPKCHLRSQPRTSTTFKVGESRRLQPQEFGEDSVRLKFPEEGGVSGG